MSVKQGEFFSSTVRMSNILGEWVLCGYSKGSNKLKKWVKRISDDQLFLTVMRKDVLILKLFQKWTIPDYIAIYVNTRRGEEEEKSYD